MNTASKTIGLADLTDVSDVSKVAKLESKSSIYEKVAKGKFNITDKSRKDLKEMQKELRRTKKLAYWIVGLGLTFMVAIAGILFTIIIILLMMST